MPQQKGEQINIVLANWQQVFRFQSSLMFFCEVPAGNQTKLVGSLLVNEVPKKPAKDCPVPKKGEIITSRITLHTWGTIRPGLNQGILSQW